MDTSEAIPASTPSPLERFAPIAALFTASVLFRLPPLINAAGTNSDAAIVGVQAMHILRGEWSWFLLGSGYQTSVDSFVAALWFAIAGPSPLALMLSTFVGHLALLGFVFATLRRRLSPWSAVLACIPLVFTTGPLHTYILYPPRQASLTIAFAAIWMIDGASSRKDPRRVLLAFGLGTAIAALAVFADPYCLIFTPIIALLVALAAIDGTANRREIGRRISAAALGAAIGAIPYWLLVHSAGASHGQTALDLHVINHNAKLLWDEGLPCVLGTRVYYVAGGDYEPWPSGTAFHAVQVIGAATLLIGIISAGALFFRRTIPWETRRLGAIGLAMLPVTLLAFLVSPMVMDFYSARYLVAFMLMAPFAILPAASLFPPKRLGVLVVPFAVVGAVSGWLHYGRYVDGASIRTAPGRAEDEQALAALLHEKGIHAAIADYWASYRLTFLFHEDPFVVPTNPAEDRYAPHRKAFETAPVVAYIFDPFRSRERPDAWENEVHEGKTPFNPDCERLKAGPFTVLLLHRDAAKTDAPRATAQ